VEFTDFVDGLVEALCFLHAVPDSKIRTNLLTHKPDGGVDTQVLQPVPDDGIDWLKDCKTMWQYKATGYSSISEKDLKKETKKDFASELIREGYAYRLCICDCLPPEKKKDWTKWLSSSVKKINAEAPSPQVLDASDLVRWANRFPMVVVRYFRRGLVGICYDWDTWREMITKPTRVYVPIPERDGVSKEISKHISLESEVPSVVFPLSGQAGVGKTRLAYESTRTSDKRRRLVGYTNDEANALTVAGLLASSPRMHAILVADECGPETRIRLSDLLRAAKDRVRVVLIQSVGKQRLSGSPEPWLERIPSENMADILAKNFPRVPADRRRAYADWAGGFVRIAADFCDFDAEIMRAGNFGPALGNICAYIDFRIPAEVDQEVLKALSLVTRVGAGGDVAFQLGDLCDLTGLDETKFRGIARRLHDSPGFVAMAGRFYYVTPEAVANVMFELAWKTWAGEAAEDFLRRIPDSLLERFLERVSRCQTEEVRRIAGEFFRGWAASLCASELASTDAVNRLQTLVEADPGTYLPVLRAIVESSTTEMLKGVKGESVDGRWGPRRALVWLGERLAGFREYFDHAEVILLRLAIAESEPGIGNNATAIWKQLFRIALSGTEVPFPDRLRKLEKRVFSGEMDEALLAVEALRGSMPTGAMRISGPAVVAGRIPPHEWTPKPGEHKECIDTVIGLLVRIAREASQQLQDKARQVVIDSARALLLFRYLLQLKEILPHSTLDDETRIQTINSVEDFLRFECAETSDRRPSNEYIEQVREWRAQLTPSDFHGRLVVLVGADPWHQHERENWKSDLASLATQVIENPHLLTEEIEWLCSPTARSAAYLGDELGREDGAGALVDLVFESAVRYGSSALARGYVNGLVNAFPHIVERVNTYIDKIGDEAPELAAEISLAGGDNTRAFQRILELVDSGKLSTWYFRRLSHGIGSRLLSQEEIERMLAIVLKAAARGDREASHAGIELVGVNLQPEAAKEMGCILENERILPQVLSLLDMTTEDGAGNSYLWAHTVTALAQRDVGQASQFAARGLVGEDWGQRRQCQQLLISLGQKHPEAVIKALGEVALDEKHGWHFHFDTYRDLVTSLPVENVISWIEEHGVEGARVLARHLPTPYVDSEGQAVVPPLTEFLLKRFEDDDRTFREFCAGVHSLQMYSGDIAAQHEKEAEIARRFLNHDLPRVREWAELEIRESLAQAKWWRQEHEELRIGE